MFSMVFSYNMIQKIWNNDYHDDNSLGPSVLRKHHLEHRNATPALGPGSLSHSEADVTP